MLDYKPREVRIGTVIIMTGMIAVVILRLLMVILIICLCMQISREAAKPSILSIWSSLSWTAPTADCYFAACLCPVWWGVSGVILSVISLTCACLYFLFCWNASKIFFSLQFMTIVFGFLFRSFKMRQMTTWVCMKLVMIHCLFKLFIIIKNYFKASQGGFDILLNML